jgi:hypothetical protein
MLRGMKRRRAAALPLLILMLTLGLGTTAAAQVATLATPDPNAEATSPPAEAIDGEQAILDFVACLRDNGLDIPDPQFGPEGPRFADPAILASLDFRSREFLDAVEACQDLLAALQPEIDPEQQAEQNEQLLGFAECMRDEGVDFPDPDPVRGLTLGSMRGADGELIIDPFSPEFQDASEVCTAQLGLEVPGGPGAQ